MYLSMIYNNLSGAFARSFSCTCEDFVNYVVFADGAVIGKVQQS